MNIEFRGATETTCAEEGFTGDLYCSDCGEKLADGKAVPVVPFHTFGEWKEITAATCTQKGTNARECVFCKTATEEEPIEAKGHTDENSDDICDVCNAATCYVIHVDETITVEYENIIALVKFVPEVSAVYSFGSISDGYNNTYGYLYDADLNELTCNDDGGDNGNFLIEYSLIAGETYYFGCRLYDTYISGSFDVRLEKLHEHDCDETVTPPTCTDGGYTTFVCKTCGESFVSNRVTATGHTPLEAAKENEVAPKCGVAGSYDLAVYCDDCGEELDRETVSVNALTHADTDGDYICDNGCGYEYEKPEEPTPDEPIPDTPDEPTDSTCDHLCHQSGFMGFIWKIVQFLSILFEINPTCKCGVAHY